MLFSGSVRTNLDPYSRHTDAELWEALGHVALKDTVSGLAEGLSARVAEGGENFSGAWVGGWVGARDAGRGGRGMQVGALACLHPRVTQTLPPSPPTPTPCLWQWASGSCCAWGARCCASRACWWRMRPPPRWTLRPTR